MTRRIPLLALAASAWLAGCGVDTIRDIPPYPDVSYSETPERILPFVGPERDSTYLWGPQNQIPDAIARTYGVRGDRQRFDQYGCLVTEDETVGYFDDWLGERGFSRDDGPKRWTLNHDDDQGSTPGITAWIRDRPADTDVDRTVFVIAYMPAKELRQAIGYAVFFGRGTMSAARAAARPAYRAPGAPGFDPDWAPPRTYPDSLELTGYQPSLYYGKDAYGRLRGWRRRPFESPECRR